MSRGQNANSECSQFQSWATGPLTAAFRISRDTQTPKHPYISTSDQSTTQMSEHIHFHSQMFWRHSESWYTSSEEYPLLRTISMRFRSFLAQTLYKTKSITVFYFSRLHLPQNCDLVAQVADHNLPELFISLCISHNPESSCRHEEEQAVPTGYSAHQPQVTPGKGNTSNFQSSAHQAGKLSLVQGYLLAGVTKVSKNYLIKVPTMAESWRSPIKSSSTSHPSCKDCSWKTISITYSFCS